MYNFIDTTEVSESVVLPSEALQINGQYIENLIDGYRTLGVVGREALSPELSYYETGVRDGSTLQSKRYPARIIIVSYQLIAKSNEAFREAYNKLGKILNVENAQLIFNDEPDKFYTGTPSTIGEVEPGRNVVVGEIEILCTDPFKYSVEEYEVEADSDSTFLIDYKGTYKSYPKVQAEFFKETEVADDGETANTLSSGGECGYVAFFDGNENILQFGDPEEAESEAAAPSQTLINQTFRSGTAWGTTAKSLWTVNKAGIVPSYMTLGGNVAMTSASSPGNGKWCLAAYDYGTGSNWHGASITRQIGADQSGEVGAVDFFLQGELFFGIAKDVAHGSKQFGSIRVQVSDSKGKEIVGFRLCKAMVGRQAHLFLYVNGNLVETEPVDVLYSQIIRSFYIRKNGANVQFNIKSFMRRFTDGDIAETKATQVTISFEKSGTKLSMYSNGISYVKFTKNNCVVPNKFGSNDVLEADCNSGEVLLNELAAPELGALGNDWEEFCLKPGINQFKFAYSDWVNAKHAPIPKIKYREVYL